MKLLQLLPREEKFYTMLQELAVHAKESSEVLKALVSTDDPAKIAQLGAQLSEIKKLAKAVNTTLVQEVCRTFITPFDREDLQRFAGTLYRIPNVMEKIKERMLTHQLRPFNHDFNRMADLIVKQGDAMESLVKDLSNGRNLDKVYRKTAQLDELEDQADQLLGDLIAESFERLEDTRELILRKDLYEMLEEITDFYRDAANLALQIILKHS